MNEEDNYDDYGVGARDVVRIDDSEKSVERTRFEDYLQFYENELVDVAISIKILDVLTEKENVKKFGRHCPAYYSATTNSLWAQSVMKLNECFNGSDYGFEKFFKYIEANWNKIFTAKWIETIHRSDGTVERYDIKWKRKDIFNGITTARNEIKEKEQTIQKIKIFRDKVFAHVDRNKPIERVNIDELEQVFLAANEVFNEIMYLYNLSKLDLRPLNCDDVNRLVYIIDAYDKLRDERKNTEEESMK